MTRKNVVSALAKVMLAAVIKQAARKVFIFILDWTIQHWVKFKVAQHRW